MDMDSRILFGNGRDGSELCPVDASLFVEGCDCHYVGRVSQ